MALDDNYKEEQKEVELQHQQAGSIVRSNRLFLQIR